MNICRTFNLILKSCNMLLHYLMCFAAFTAIQTIQLQTHAEPNTFDFSAGLYSVGEVTYEYPLTNDSTLTPFSNNLTTQIRGQLYYPDVQKKDAILSPILIFLPGKHADCRLSVPEGFPALDLESVDNAGHCPFNLKKVPSHLGFAYLARYFASHGYIVLSVDIIMINNKWGIPGDSTLNFVRARIVLRTIEKIIEWNKSSVESKRVLQGLDLSGRFDVSEVGLMGHSRGGEGVRNAYNILMEGRGVNDTYPWREKLANVRIQAVMEIAPMYYGENSIRLGVERIPWGMIVAGCEDDEIDYIHVNLAYWQSNNAKAPNHVLHIYGANHEYFNTEWQVGIPMCFGDQEPLWDVNATTFKVSDIYPPAANTSMDLTLLKINGSESQRQAAVFVLATFFRAYVGKNANQTWAEQLKPSTSLPSNLSFIGREYFDNSQSIVIYNGSISSSLNVTDDVQMKSLKDYARFEYDAFVQEYRNTSVEPPHFILNPPRKDELSLGCLDSIEDAIHINFNGSHQGMVTINFQANQIKHVQYLDIQLSRRDSCWFHAPYSPACSHPREMLLRIQVETSSGSSSQKDISFRSRYNLQFARCNAMDQPPEKLAFLPVMFETLRIPVLDKHPLTAVRFRSTNGGSIILGQIRAHLATSGTTSSIQIPKKNAAFFLTCLIFIYIKQ